MKDIKKPDSAAAPANEGEGNRTAARNYDKKAEAFANSGKVTQKAREAQIAVDGPEGKELAKAEAEGTARATSAGRVGHGKPAGEKPQ